MTRQEKEQLINSAKKMLVTLSAYIMGESDKRNRCSVSLMLQLKNNVFDYFSSEENERELLDDEGYIDTEYLYNSVDDFVKPLRNFKPKQVYNNLTVNNFDDSVVIAKEMLLYLSAYELGYIPNKNEDDDFFTVGTMERMRQLIDSAYSSEVWQKCFFLDDKTLDIDYLYDNAKVCSLTTYYDRYNLPFIFTITAEKLQLDTDDIVEDEEEFEEWLLDYLSDMYGYCISKFNYDVKYNEENIFSELILEVYWDVED